MIKIKPEHVRESLMSFWEGALEIASVKDGVSIAPPLCYPDGWQIVINVLPLTNKVVRITDHGKTLLWLSSSGQNIDTPTIQSLLNEKMKVFELTQTGWEIYRDIEWPIKGIDLQLFGEGLVAIAYLNYLHEPNPKTANVARQTLEKVFKERKLEMQQNHCLEGLVEKKITVDYFVNPVRPVAFQVLGRRGTVTNYMEQWGFRWRDLRDANPKLLPAMIYDPAVQDIDSTARAIGDAVCELFCPYDETDKIHELLARANKN